MSTFDVLTRARRIVQAAILILTLAAASHAQQSVAQCETQCSSDCKDAAVGKSAIAACIGGCARRCEPKTVQGQVHPKYLILAIVYAPPGCTASNADKCTQSKVDYGSSTQVGTKISTSASFKVGENVSVSFGGGGGSSGSGGGGDSLSLGAGFSVTTTDSASETINKTQSSDIPETSIEDGVDHDLDTFFLLLNPVVNVAQQSTNVLWNLGISGPFGVLQTLTVSELKNPSTMPTGVAQAFAKLGFTTSDYQTILSQDPFASGGSIDPNRFVPTTLSFPYEPPGAGACVNGQCICAALQQSISNQLVNEVSNSLQSSYTVSLSSGFSIPSLASFKTTDSFTWTDQASTANTTTNSQTATAQIQCPSPAYTSSQTGMAAYWDALYGTFAFVPFDPSTVAVIHRGTLTDSAGKPVRGQALSLTVGGLTYQTVSGNNGAYEFAAPWMKKTIIRGFPGTGLLKVKGVQQTVQLGSSTPPVRIRIQ